jgi:hypothetical protein
MQGQPMEGGGFRGRTNKLVDGCYGWWNGGLFAILSALIGPKVVDRPAVVIGLDSPRSSETEWEDEGVCKPSQKSVKVMLTMFT